MGSARKRGTGDSREEHPVEVLFADRVEETKVDEKGHLTSFSASVS